MKSIGSRRRGLERGFTLVELMIVVTIIGILIAIGIPTLLGARHRASDAAAKAAATRALKSQKVLYADANQQYGDADQLKEVEPSLNVVDYTTGSVPQVLGRVYVKNDAGVVATMVARSSSGTCFWTRDENGITSYATNDCSDEPADGDFGPGW